MNPPTTLPDLLVWLLAQFPILAGVGLSGWAVHRTLTTIHLRHLADLERCQGVFQRSKDEEVARLVRSNQELYRELRNLRADWHKGR